MKYLVFGLLLAAPPAMGQAANEYEATVQACYEATPSGERNPACVGAATKACIGKLAEDKVTPNAITSCTNTEAWIWVGLETKAYGELLQKLEERDAKRSGEGDDLSDALKASQDRLVEYWSAECALTAAMTPETEDVYLSKSKCTRIFAVRRSLQLRDMIRSEDHSYFE